jgi:NADH pyrophosphatase NudC (nudix superfamily)
MMFNRCPGVSKILMPTIKLKSCPNCGEQIEFVSSDMKINCPKCSFTVYNDTASCIQWCKYARECVGEETYQKLMEERNKKIKPHKGLNQ